MVMNVEARQKLERELVEYLIDAAAASGFRLVAAQDGEEVFKNPSKSEAMDAVFSVDDSSLVFQKDDGKKRMVSIVLGNDGWDCIADHSYDEKDPDGFCALMDRVGEYADRRGGEIVHGVDNDGLAAKLRDPDAVKEALRNIQTLLEEARNVFVALPPDEQNVFMDVHVADRSLGVLLRDALTNTEELVTKLDTGVEQRQELG